MSPIILFLGKLNGLANDGGDPAIVLKGRSPFGRAENSFFRYPVERRVVF